MSDIAGRSIEFDYVNWRGELSRRWATPSEIRWGVNEWHTEPQWLMRAFDHDKGQVREFALLGIRHVYNGAADA